MSYPLIPQHFLPSAAAFEVLSKKEESICMNLRGIHAPVGFHSCLPNEEMNFIITRDLVLTQVLHM